jgi:hypothetical protein
MGLCSKPKTFAQAAGGESPMPSPFPGMDPYLEKPSLWPDLHIELITAIRAVLKTQLGPSYRVRIEERVYISTADDPGRSELVPDIQIVSRTMPGSSVIVSKTCQGVEIAEPLVIETLTAEEIHEPYLEISDAASRKVLTVIEVLSPTNKVSRSQGLKSFRKKRDAIMISHSRWVEIDLFRRGISLGVRKRIRPHEYLIHVSPVGLRLDGLSLVWPIRLSERLPVIPIPLHADQNTPLDIQEVLNTAYDRGGNETEVDYTEEPVPPLSKEWRVWADRVLHEKGLRPPPAAE